MEAINKQLDELRETITIEFKKVYEETPGERHDRFIRDNKNKEIGEEYIREDSLYRIPGSLPMGPGLGLFTGDWNKTKGGKKRTSKRGKSKKSKSKRSKSKRSKTKIRKRK
jgi:hypothetical protein